MLSVSAWFRQHALEHHLIGDEVWQPVLNRIEILQGLTPEQLHDLRERASLFLLRKKISTVDGLELSDIDRACIATLAEQILLGLEDKLKWFQGFHEVSVYPDAFVTHRSTTDTCGIVHQEPHALSGEAWHQGGVVLDWKSVQEGFTWGYGNVVAHEMSHKLDMLNGSANGCPPLHSNMCIETWSKVMQSAFDHLCKYVEQHGPQHSPINAYGTTNPAEFFAVITEYFFNAPHQLHKVFPEVYAQYKLFYRQDPIQLSPHA